MKIAAFSAAALALVLGGCATQKSAGDAAGPRECFNASYVSNYAVQDSSTVNVRAGQEVYQLKLLGVCPDIQWSQAVRLSTEGSAQVCTGLDVTIAVPTSMGAQECAAESMRHLSADEVRALPPGARP